MFRRECRAALVPPGYISLLFAHLYEDSSCPLPTPLFAGFRRFLLAAFGLDQAEGVAAAAAAALAAVGAQDAGGGGAGAAAAGGSSSSEQEKATAAEVVTVRLISRRPGAPGKAGGGSVRSSSSGKMARQISNEDELLEALQSLGAGAEGGGAAGGLAVAVSRVDFATLTGGWAGRGWAGWGGVSNRCLQPSMVASALCYAEVTVPTSDLSPFVRGAVEQQLALVQQTDVLVGMHGAGLAHALLLPPHAALVELWPQVGGGRGLGRMQGMM